MKKRISFEGTFYTNHHTEPRMGAGGHMHNRMYIVRWNGRACFSGYLKSWCFKGAEQIECINETVEARECLDDLLPIAELIYLDPLCQVRIPKTCAVRDSDATLNAIKWGLQTFQHSKPDLYQREVRVLNELISRYFTTSVNFIQDLAEEAENAST